MIKAIIFDCFGVVLGNPYKLVLQDIMTKNPVLAEEVRGVQHAADMGILSRDEAASYMSEKIGITKDEFFTIQNKGEVRNQELIERIHELRADFKVAMVSNISGRDRLDIRFEPGQLDSLFDTVIASGDVGHTKPEPEIYQLAAEQLGVLPNECIMLDDIAEFCEGARAVGMQAIQFISTTQALEDLAAHIDRGGKTD